MTASTNTETSRKTQPVPSTEPQGQREPNNLSVRYGTIGIQAVAAAARYIDPNRTPAPAKAHRIDQRFVESAG